MYRSEQLGQLANQAQRKAYLNGINRTCIEYLGIYKATQTTARCPSMDGAGVGLVCQGTKKSYIGANRFDFEPGKIMVGLFPIPVETEVVKASEHEPFLLVGLAIDLPRMANILSKLEQIEEMPPKPSNQAPSNMVSMPLSDALLDPFDRLMGLIDHPRDAAMLSSSIIDEIYYRILTHEDGGGIRALIGQSGDFQRISKAIAYIHQHLNQPVSVDSLAEMVHMSRTAFFKSFKAVMHIPPHKYAKAVKLAEAQKLILSGKRINEAGQMVGYGVPAQFSREYKRHFGYPASETNRST